MNGGLKPPPWAYDHRTEKTLLMIMMAAGPTITTKIAGKMQRMSGKIILTGAF